MSKQKISKPKTTIKTKILGDREAKIVKDQDGRDHVVVLEQRTYFSFTNLRPGLCFFKREDGKEDFFKGEETKSDITEKEREIFLTSLDFENGWLVEEKENEEISEESVTNKNALSDSRLTKFVLKHKGNSEKLKSFITEMSSDFSLKRMKDALLALEMPSSLMMCCDLRLKELEEEYLATKKAPIMGEGTDR